MEPVRRAVFIAILLAVAWSARASDRAAFVAPDAGDSPAGDAVAARVQSSGATLPLNGKPTLVFVDAAWCPFCAIARPVMQALRPEYQDRVNFVVLDYDRAADLALARALRVGEHPAFAIVVAGGGTDAVIERRFGPQPPAALRAALDRAVGR